MAEHYTDQCLFYYIDVDIYEDLKEEFKVKGIPHFFIIEQKNKDFKIVDEMTGCDAIKLYDLIDDLIS